MIQMYFLKKCINEILKHFKLTTFKYLFFHGRLMERAKSIFCFFVQIKNTSNVKDWVRIAMYVITYFDNFKFNIRYSTHQQESSKLHITDHRNYKFIVQYNKPHKPLIYTLLLLTRLYAYYNNIIIKNQILFEECVK